MDIWSADKLYLFLAFVIPGFVAMRVYSLIVPSRDLAIGATLLHAIGYSCIYYAAVSWLLVLAIRYKFAFSPLFVVIVLLGLPVLMGVLFAWARKTKFVSAVAPHPVPTAWDHVFGRREAYWVIVTLADGRRIGGMYDRDSFSSSYPEEPQIYMQQVWEVSADNAFLAPVPRSRGVLLLGKNIESIELFS